MLLILTLYFKGARELVLDEENQLNESKTEIKQLKEKLEVQVCKIAYILCLQPPFPKLSRLRRSDIKGTTQTLSLSVF